MKIKILITISLFIFAISLFITLTPGCSMDARPSSVPVTGVILDREALYLVAGDDPVTLTAEVLPEDADDKSVSWSSGNTDIALVNAGGTVTPVGTGETIVTVTTNDGGYTAGCAATVSAASVPVEQIVLDKENIYLVVNGTQQLCVSFVPANATNKNVSWSSNDDTIASVDGSGKVTAIAEGSTVVTVTSEDGGHTASCAINVTNAPVPVTGVSLDRERIVMGIGGTVQLTAEVMPENADNKSLTWRSDKPDIVDVDETGKVTYVNPAPPDTTPVITVTTEDGLFSDSCEVVMSPYTHGAFVTQWTILPPADVLPKVIEFPLDEEGTYDFSIDWGDGTVESYSTHNVSHIYTDYGSYNVIVTGRCDGFGFESDSLNPLIVEASNRLSSVLQWGNVKLHNKGYQLYNCRSLSIDALDNPDLSDITNMHGMFYGTFELRGDFTGWDTSAVEDMSSMLFRVIKFNSDISGWNTGNVKNMDRMFFAAYEFNQDIGAWDTSSVESMRGMFGDAKNFNQDIGRWDTSSVESMFAMFAETESFNQDLSFWNTGNVSTMRNMFYKAAAFTNGDNPEGLNGWSVQTGCDTEGMFTDRHLDPLPEWF